MAAAKRYYEVQTTINPGVWVRVDEDEYDLYTEMEIIEGVPVGPIDPSVFDAEIAGLIADVNSQTFAAVAAIPPDPHMHPASEISDAGAFGRSLLQDSTKLEALADLTLDQVSNTADADKPVSTAQAAAIAAASTADRVRANHTGTQTSATLSDLTETVQDIVGALVVAGSNMTVSYDDATGQITLTSTAGAPVDPEIVRDTIGSALVAGSGIQITVNDAGDTITIASTAVLPTRQVISGTGLSGGGDLSVDRTLAVAYGSTAGTAVQGNDARVTADQAAGTASIRTLGTTATSAAAGNHTHTATGISDSTAVGRAVLTAATAAAARTATGAGVVDSDGTVLQTVKVTAAAHAALVTAGTTVATRHYLLVG